MAVGTAVTLIGAAIAAIGTIVGGAISSKDAKSGRRAAEVQAEIQRSIQAKQLSDQRLQQRQQNVLTQQNIDLEGERFQDAKEDREKTQAQNLNRQQVQDTLGMINQSQVMSNNLRNVFDDKEFL